MTIKCLRAVFQIKSKFLNYTRWTEIDVTNQTFLKRANYSFDILAQTCPMSQSIRFWEKNEVAQSLCLGMSISSLTQLFKNCLAKLELAMLICILIIPRLASYFEGWEFNPRQQQIFLYQGAKREYLLWTPQRCQEGHQDSNSSAPLIHSTSK